MTLEGVTYVCMHMCTQTHVSNIFPTVAYLACFVPESMRSEDLKCMIGTPVLVFTSKRKLCDQTQLR